MKRRALAGMSTLGGALLLSALAWSEPSEVAPVLSPEEELGSRSARLSGDA